MKPILKSIATFVAVAAMVMAMTAVTFATDDGTQLIIHKELTVKNASLQSVYGPGIAYTYSVVPATVASGTKVGNTVVHAGPADGLTIASTPTFAVTDSLSASSSGASNTKNLVLAVDKSKFSAPGVYRYLLTDTTTAANLAAAGIVRDTNFNAERYIDVYLTRNDSTGGLDVGGYVVQAENEITGDFDKEDFTGDSVPNAVSTNGDNNTTVDPSMDMGASETNYVADSFATYNVQVSKTVTGNMGDKQHEFPMAGAIAGNNGRKVFVSENTAATSSSTEVTDIPSNVTLKHGDTYYVAGLSPNATIAWTETNDTEDDYTTTVAGGNGTKYQDAQSLVAGGTIGVTAQHVSNYSSSAAEGTANADTAAITFTNDFTSVSPTGIVMRFGAPLIILLAAIALVVMNRKAKAGANK